MSDLNEKLAQEAAELINGGEWRDGKWYSEGHRDAWRRALKPAAERIEQLEDSSEGWKEIADEYFDAICERNTRIEKLEAALRFYGDKHHWRKQHHRDLNKDFWTFAAQDDGGKVARKALEGKDDAD